MSPRVQVWSHLVESIQPCACSGIKSCLRSFWVLAILLLIILYKMSGSYMSACMYIESLVYLHAWNYVHTRTQSYIRTLLCCEYLQMFMCMYIVYSSDADVWIHCCDMQYHIRLWASGIMRGVFYHGLIMSNGIVISSKTYIHYWCDCRLWTIGFL